MSLPITAVGPLKVLMKPILTGLPCPAAGPPASTESAATAINRFRIFSPFNMLGAFPHVMLTDCPKRQKCVVSRMRDRSVAIPVIRNGKSRRRLILWLAVGGSVFGVLLGALVFPRGIKNVLVGI